jgi:hypothetical protein
MMEYQRRFSLTKWYLDCVTENGDAIMCYVASLRWKMLSWKYSSILVRRLSGLVGTKATLHRGTFPKLEADGVRWECHHPAIKGTWKGLEPSFQHKIFASSKTPLSWRCVQPRAEVEIDAGTFGRFSGYGYVDFLEMTAKPWQLPLEELRWGRFLSPTDSIIWIDIRGPLTECLLFHNGIPVMNGRVLDTEVDFGDLDLHLTFEETEVLREGALASTALSVIPGVNKLLPDKMLNTKECKWRSRGALWDGNKIKCTGWTIHEVVKWPSSTETRKA